MVTCFLCQKSFTNNLGGQLTNHLSENHKMSLSDYVILTEHGGLEPRCACGLCDERPVFSRGKFLTYAKFHQNFKERERRWIEKNGIPECSFCNRSVKFVRGDPKKYCSSSCSMKDGRGFSNPNVQKKISNAVLERYDVTNVSHMQEVKFKISRKLKGKHKGTKLSTETKQKISISVKERWKNDDYRKRVSKRIKQSINDDLNEIQRRKLWLKSKMADPEFKENNFKSSRNRLSKLHQRLRSVLGLEQLGFESEQRIGKFFVDEINRKKNVIIEIFGDYPHANPKKFDDDFVIKLVGQSYTASQKRHTDELRLSLLREMGYKIIVVWESDNLKEKKKEIQSAIAESNFNI